MKLDPLSPSRADHRFLRKLASILFGGKTDPSPEDLDLVCRVFRLAGGSWEHLFLGSTRELTLLKKILKVAYRKGHLTKAPEWK